jgi:hypothetical protein
LPPPATALATQRGRVESAKKGWLMASSMSPLPTGTCPSAPSAGAPAEGPPSGLEWGGGAWCARALSLAHGSG